LRNRHIMLAASRPDSTIGLPNARCNRVPVPADFSLSVWARPPNFQLGTLGAWLNQFFTRPYRNPRYWPIRLTADVFSPHRLSSWLRGAVATDP
jgi:hypothetical protein